MATEQTPLVSPHPLLAVPPRPSSREAVRRFLLDMRETERRCVLLLHDIGLVAGCVSGALALVGLWPWGWPLVGVWVAIAVATLYSTEQYALSPHHDRALELAVGLGALGAAAMALALDPPVRFLASWLVAFGAVGMLLPAGRRMLEVWLTARPTRSRWLIMGTPQEGREILDELRRHPLAGRSVMGLVLSRGQLPQPFPLLVLGTPAHLGMVATRWAADGVIAGLEVLQTPDWHARLSDTIAMTDMPTLCARLSGRLPVRHVDERWFVEHFRWRRGWLYRGTRRSLDLGVSGVALVAFAPVMALIAIAVRLEDGGPALSAQAHMGLGGRPFTLCSFRTMRMGTGAGETRVGQFLRATRLHKLPRLWGVWRGELALVGPSPHEVELASDLAQYVPHYARRQVIKPGLTGWAQVRDPFGAPVRAPERVLGHDLFYVYQRSWRLDMVILIRTVFVVLARLTAPRR